MSDVPTPEVSDLEVVMHMFRLARTERYSSAKQLIAATRQDMPEITDSQMKRCVETLARKLEQ